MGEPDRPTIDQPLRGGVRKRQPTRRRSAGEVVCDVFGRGHRVTDGLPGEAREVPAQLPHLEEQGSEHLRDGEHHTERVRRLL